MSQTRIFRKQHDDLITVASEISTHLDVDKLSINASEVRSLLSKLLGKLKIHLSMEDKSLYPKLLEHPNEKIKSMARRFIDEMGDIGKIVDTYADEWPSASRIRERPDDFIEQTRGIIKALANRIGRENNELYKALDDLTANEVSQTSPMLER